MYTTFHPCGLQMLDIWVTPHLWYCCLKSWGPIGNSRYPYKLPGPKPKLPSNNTHNHEY